MATPSPRSQSPSRVTLVVRIIYTNHKAAIFKCKEPSLDSGNLLVPQSALKTVRGDLTSLSIPHPKKDCVYFSTVWDGAAELLWPNLEYPRSARPLEIKFTSGLEELAPRLGPLSISGIISYIIPAQTAPLHYLMPAQSPCGIVLNLQMTTPLLHHWYSVWGKCPHRSHPIIPSHQSQYTTTEAFSSSVPTANWGYVSQQELSQPHIQAAQTSPILSVTQRPVSRVSESDNTVSTTSRSSGNVEFHTGDKRRREPIDGDDDASDAAARKARRARELQSAFAVSSRLPPQLPAASSEERKRDEKQESTERSGPVEGDKPRPAVQDILRGLKHEIGSLRREVQSLREQVMESASQLKLQREEHARQIRTLRWGHENPHVAASLTGALLQISEMSRTLRQDSRNTATAVQVRQSASRTI